MSKNKSIVMISDYGVGDPAFTEVVLQLHIRLPESFIYPQSTPPFSTLNTGFWVYQIALTPSTSNTYIFSNTAPRKTNKEAQKDNKGERLMYAKLENGFELMAVNAGYVFSFVKPYIKEFHHVNVANQGSQFRSRDYYPQAVAQMVLKDPAFLGEKAALDGIPDYPHDHLMSIDGYGNLKTSTRSSEINLTPGQKVTVTIGDQTQQATYTDGVFNIAEGELAFAPGSSGHSDRFMELFVRGGSAHELFKHPKVESAFEIA